jgi:tetratricopeptide (TPR) repeat protein
LNEGVALIQAQRLTDARDALLDVTRLQPQNLRAWYNLGLAYRTLGEGDSAIDAFERVTRIDPNDADTLYFLGQLHSQAGRHDQAIAVFLKCLSLDGRHVSAEFGLSRAYQLSQQRLRSRLARFDELEDRKPISRWRAGTPFPAELTRGADLLQQNSPSVTVDARRACQNDRRSEERERRFVATWLWCLLY